MVPAEAGGSEEGSAASPLGAASGLGALGPGLGCFGFGAGATS